MEVLVWKFDRTPGITMPSSLTTCGTSLLILGFTLVKRPMAPLKAKKKKRYDACVCLANCSRIDMWLFTLRWCHLEGESLDNDLNSVD